MKDKLNIFWKFICICAIIPLLTTCVYSDWATYKKLEDEAVVAGVGGNFASYDGRLVYNLDGTGAPAAETSWAHGDALYDGYAVKDDDGNLVTIRQYDAARGIYHGSSSSSGKVSSSPACEHEYTSEVTKEPTCVEPGEMTYTCSKCGHTYTEEIPPTGEHDFEITVEKEPTCTETGLTVKVCKVCGYREEVVMPALGHDYEETVTKEPTCTEPGVRTFTCKNCGDTYTEEIPALGHDESEWVVVKEPGWFTPGLKHTTCKRCGEVLNSEEIPQMYPMWYLYTGIGIVTALLGGVAFLLYKKIRKQ